MRTAPIVFTWREFEVADDDGVLSRRMVMVPLARYGNVAARQFHAGEEYPLVVMEERSRASHSQYFAALHEGFQNLPEKIAPRWPTPEHLRAWLLIETGWFDELEVDLKTDAQVKALIARIRSESPYARVQRHELKLIIRYAKSQSAAAMGKALFEASKKDVLDLLEDMTGVPRGTLKKEAGRVA